MQTTYANKFLSLLLLAALPTPFSTATTTQDPINGAELNGPVPRIARRSGHRIPESAYIPYFYHDRIIPDVIPTSLSFHPYIAPTILYQQPKNATTGPPSGNYSANGDLLSLNITSSPPILYAMTEGVGDPAQKAAGGDCVYTLALTDPDATSRDDPTSSEICHWIVTGLKPYKRDAQDPTGMGAVQTVIEYKAPAPPKGTGVHRYTFLVFRRADCKAGELVKPSDRVRWGDSTVRHNAVAWAANNNLALVGATFMQAMHGY